MNSANLFNLNYSAIAESEKSRLLELIACSDSLLLETSAEFMRAQRLVGSLRRCLHKNTGAIAIRIWADDAESAGNQLNLARHQLGVQAVDLVQLEIRGDWRGQLQLLQSRVELGEVVNIGLVARHPDQYAAVEEAVHADAVQYIRLVYSAVERDAELRLMPLAQERGVRLLADRIFASGKLLDQTVGRKLPNWLIASGISTWEQLWFQYSISHPAVDTVMVPIRSLDGLLCYEKWLKDILLSPGQREEVARLAANLI